MSQFTIVIEMTAVAWMSFYSTWKTTKTKVQFPALCEPTFCAILLAFCCVIPKHSWCWCSSCRQDCPIADAPYSSPRYETKCTGSAVLAVPLYLHKELLPTAVSEPADLIFTQTVELYPFSMLSQKKGHTVICCRGVNLQKRYSLISVIIPPD